MRTFLHVCLWLGSLTLALPAQTATLLVFGDSLSAGYGIPREKAWPALLQQELAQTHPGWRVVNASVSGETTAGGWRRLAAALAEHQPAVLLLELGANDGLRGAPLAETERNLERMIVTAKQHGVRVLLLGMQLPPNYGAGYAQRFADLYPALARKHRIPLVSFLLQGIAPEQFQPDNLHPDASAQPLIVRNVLPLLRPLLRQP